MKEAAKENLYQIRDLLEKIDNVQYTEKAEVLSGSSIGQHIRHILEFYLLLISGSYTGKISYDKRQRDIRIEKSPEFALKTVENILIGIDSLNSNVQVEFDADYSIEGSLENRIISSVGRELAYCIEHSIHHQAMIKAGLIIMGLKEITDDNFGVAYSTIRYRNNQCAQ